MMLSFFFSGILSFQMDGMGKLKIMKSDTTLNIPEAFTPAFALMQWPVVSSGFQILSRGMHWKMSNMVLMK